MHKLKLKRQCTEHSEAQEKQENVLSNFLLNNFHQSFEVKYFTTHDKLEMANAKSNAHSLWQLVQDPYANVLLEFRASNTLLVSRLLIL